MIYSAKLYKILKKVNSPIAQFLIRMGSPFDPRRTPQLKEGSIIKEGAFTSNYFNIGDTNDTITFITNHKLVALVSPKIRKVSYTSNERGGLLTHNVQKNGKIFERLNYVPKGEQMFRPESGDYGEVLGETLSKRTQSRFLRLRYGKNECVVNIKSTSAYNYLNDVWKENRQSVRIGRLVKSILKFHNFIHNDSQLEDFVNKWKAAYDLASNVFRNFEIVKGDDIKHWYRYENYEFQKGQLSNSCMCRVSPEYLSIYAANENCRLLILRSDDVEGKIVGRALLWNISEPSAILMDRIYTNNDSDVNLFREFAKKEGWLIKSHADEKLYVYSESSDKAKCLGWVEVKLEKSDFKSYPYLDTLRYLDPVNHILTNKPKKGFYNLSSTGGGYNVIS